MPHTCHGELCHKFALTVVQNICIQVTGRCTLVLKVDVCVHILWYVNYLLFNTVSLHHKYLVYMV